jgi:dolichol-phosphate mannosyltransferase
MIGIEYLMLIADKLIGRIVPIRFVMFLAVGATGVLTHLAALWGGLNVAHLSFPAAQGAATLVAMIGNFVLNNRLTYRDRRLTGWKFLSGLVSFCLICGVGAVANVGIASVLFADHALWWLAGLAGAAMSVVWNYAVTSALTWRNG